MPTTDKRDYSDKPRVGPFNCTADQAAALLRIADAELASQELDAERMAAQAEDAPADAPTDTPPAA